MTWKIPLYALVSSQAINFEVDFWAWGFFNDTKSQLVANDSMFGVRDLPLLAQWTREGAQRTRGRSVCAGNIARECAQ